MSSTHENSGTESPYESSQADQGVNSLPAPYYAHTAIHEGASSDAHTRSEAIKSLDSETLVATAPPEQQVTSDYATELAVPEAY